MKTKITFVLIPVVLLSCSKKSQPGDSPPSILRTEPSQTSAPKITFVDCPETKDRRQILEQAAALLAEKNYLGLEELAAKYRASKEQYADGFWKLALIYNGLELPRRASDVEWQARQKEIQGWIKARPDSVTPRIAMGRLWTSYAWKARGGGYADTVKDQNWATFHSRLRSAEGYLKEAARLKEKCPVYWSSLQQIALGLQYEKTKYNGIFVQAIQEFPEYQYYYNARATFLLPRWYGEEGELELDLAKSADRIGGEGGDELYAQVIWSVNRYGSSGIAGTLFKADRSIWERADRGFEIILKKYPDSLATKTERAFQAALAQDKLKARRYFLETGGQVDLEHWDSKEVFEKFLNWTFSP